jgi:GDPmannose 4,6-dehydratase
MSKKIALVTGISGQDGAYLAKYLLKKNYTVIGTDRRSSRSNNWRIEELNILDKIILEDLDITETSNIERIFKKFAINEVYNLAAQSFVKSSFENPIQTSIVNAISPLSFLEIIRNQKRKIKFYQASTSEMFGKHNMQKQNEQTVFYPRSPYATSKTFAHYTVRNYREAYKIFAVSGILFNHESPLRGEEFITRKITIGLAKIILGKQKKIKIGNLYAKRDWGYAGDYVQAMWKMLQNKTPKDYVIATGKNYSVKNFIDTATNVLNLKTKWVGKGLNEKLINLKDKKIIVEIDKKYFRPTEVETLKGDFSKAFKELNWKPKTNFKNLVKMMITADLNRY